MTEELDPVVSIKHDHIDEGPDTSRQWYTSEHCTVTAEQLTCLLYICFLSFFFFPKQNLLQKGACLLFNYTTIRQQGMEQKRLILDSNDHIHMQANLE